MNFYYKLFLLILLIIPTLDISAQNLVISKTGKIEDAFKEIDSLKAVVDSHSRKIDLTNYFDDNAVANDENSKFILGTFINNAAFVVPSNSPGIRIRTILLQRFYIQLAFSKAENTGSRIFNDIYKAI